jgi:rubrerythrin
MTATPSPAPGSTQDLLALANALEREAARRYRELAERLRLAGEPELEALFGFLAGLEDKHGDQIAEQADACSSGDPPPSIATWDLPENFDEEAARSAKLTPYTALAIAVRNEERAFAFYCHAAAAAANDDVRRIAENLARDELHHASLLRHARRAAFRREDRHADREKAADPLPQTPAAFRVLAEQWRVDAALGHHALAEALEKRGVQRLAMVFRLVANEELGAAAAALGSFSSGDPGNIDHGWIRDGIRRIEVMFDRFCDIAERTSDVGILAEAQRAAESCLRWLALTGGAWRNELLDRSPSKRGPE